MSTIFMSSKGGNCTTVTASAYALVMGDRGMKTIFIDLCGDAPSVLGLAESTSAGINDWLGENSPTDASGLLQLGTPVTENVMLVHRGSRFVEGEPRWQALADFISQSTFNIVIDAGTGFLPPELTAVITEVTMVLKPCYLSLRRATQQQRPNNVVVITEEGRALTVSDVSHVIGVPVFAQVPYEAAISRAVDAGLLVSRAPSLFQRHFVER